LSPVPPHLFELNWHGPEAIVLTEWMALPVLGHQDSGEIWMAFKGNAKEIPYLSLHCLCPWVKTTDRLHHRITLGNLDTKTEFIACSKVTQNTHDLEPLGHDMLREPGVGRVQVIDTAQIREKLKPTSEHALYCGKISLSGYKLHPH